MPSSSPRAVEGPQVRRARPANQASRSAAPVPAGQMAGRSPGVGLGELQAHMGSGTPLADAQRGFFEPRLGHDLSGVRIHAGDLGQTAAQELQARAFTYGNHVAFGRSEYAPETAAGQRLLAHELTHVVQQGAAPALNPSSTLGHALTQGVPAIQRKVTEGIVKYTDPIGDPNACLVHLHGDEQNSLEVAKDMQATRCVNLVHLDGTARVIHVTVPSGTVTFDPNRIYFGAEQGNAATAADLAKLKVVSKTSKVTSPDEDKARQEVWDFVKDELAPAIGRCREGKGNTIAGPLPVIALHNNDDFPAGTIDITKYEPGGSSRADVDTTRVPPADNPSRVTDPKADAWRRDVDNMVLVTELSDFNALKGKLNVVLQSRTPTADGSLSVALANERYVNVEAEGKTFGGYNKPLFLNNRTEVIEVLDQAIAVDRRPCSGRLFEWVLELIQDMLDGFRPMFDPFFDLEVEVASQLLDDLIRVRNALTAPITCTPTKGCLSFCTVRDLEDQRLSWQRRIFEMRPAVALEWIIGRIDCAGGTAPAKTPGGTKLTALEKLVLCGAFGEAKQQMDCLTKELGAPAPFSGHRTFTWQRNRWEAKYTFTHTDVFDRVTKAARDLCLLELPKHVTKTTKATLKKRFADASWLDKTAFVENRTWDPVNKTQTDVTAVQQYAWMNVLTPELRQQQVMQGTAPPGESRHHWGTDFDLYTDDPLAFCDPSKPGDCPASPCDPATDPKCPKPGGKLKEYKALQAKALGFGFFQPYQASNPSPSHMEERWHWSYYPVAQALLNLSTRKLGAGGTSGGDLETALDPLWKELEDKLAKGKGVKDPFTWVRANWRSLMKNVKAPAEVPEPSAYWAPPKK